jgi:hypothetical protein
MSATNAAISSSGSAVEVGLFGLQTIARRVAAVLGVERHLDRGRPRRGGEVRIDRERRPGVDHLGAGLEQRVAGRQQHVARAVADRDPVRRHAVPV